jgi:hypothetical protein
VAWARNQTLTEKSFEILKSFKESLDYIYFVNDNGYDRILASRDILPEGGGSYGGEDKTLLSYL